MLRITPGDARKAEAPYELVKTMRASVLVLGPLLARYGRARISLPGGCAIGARPIDQHLRGLELMGARTSLSEGYIEASADRLSGAAVTFDMKTVTGTENLMMAASLAEGTTVLSNAAQEPEVCDLARLLRAMGADIEGEGTDEIVVGGPFPPRGAPRGDGGPGRGGDAAPGRRDHGRRRDGAGRGRLVDERRRRKSFRRSGADVDSVPGGVRVRREGPIRSVNVKTAPYPGFPTDVQAQFMAYMCLGDGFSIISETIFENRFMHVAELRRMGARIDVSGNTAAVKGVPALSGGRRSWRPTFAPRLRWCLRAWPRRGRPRCSGSTTSTAGTRRWNTGSLPWAPTSPG